MCKDNFCIIFQNWNCQIQSICLYSLSDTVKLASSGFFSRTVWGTVSPCSHEWLGTQRRICFCFLSAENAGVYHHTWPVTAFLIALYSQLCIKDDDDYALKMSKNLRRAMTFLLKWKIIFLRDF